MYFTLSSFFVVCICLSTNAVHAAMAGKTGMVICHHHNTFIHVPIERAIYYIKRVNPEGPLYRTALDVCMQRVWSMPDTPKEKRPPTLPARKPLVEINLK